jgi:predicted anti-sigma-YlaC factor YlaD
LHRDWLFLVGVALGVAGVGRALWRSNGSGWLTIVFVVVFAILQGILVTGIVGGSVREYRRGRHGAP